MSRAHSSLRTLVLNAGYEPMSVVPYRRAIVLVLGQKGQCAGRRARGAPFTASG
jgi:hypothetical protein